MTYRKLESFVTVALALVAPWAHAQIRPAYSYPAQAAGSGPAGVQLLDTPVYVTPYVGLGATYDDNLFLAKSGKKASMLYLTRPGFQFHSRRPASVISL